MSLDFELNGWNKESSSPKDKDFSKFKGFLKVASAPVKSHIIKELTPISGQGLLGSCVANAIADALEILMGLNGNVIQLSRLFIYYNSRLYDKATQTDGGTYIRNGFDSLKRFGVCREDVWAYDVSKVFSQPSIEAYSEANDNQIEGYYRISSGDNDLLNDIEKAILADHPVVFGTGVSQEFCNFFKNEEKVWAPPATIVGGHAMIIVGFRYNASNKREFLIRNSWSENWGQSGHTWLSESYILSGYSSDFWVPTLMPALVI